MATSNEATKLSELSTDIYQIAEFVDSIKAKYVDIPEDTLALGVFGYLGSVFTNVIENTSTMASEYSNEAIPTKAKFERNIIAHALALGINKIFATPAELEVLMMLPERILLNNMVNNKFVLDKEYAFTIGEDQLYPYHLDYDIVIRRDKMPNGSYVYTAKYDIDGRNEMAELTNPYLPALSVVNLEGDSMVSFQVTLRQMVHTEIYKKIIMQNPLENKVITFEFSDQLAFFYVEVVEDGITHFLKPVYDGLFDYTSNDEFINYMFLDEKNIRLVFNRDSYQPRQNADVTIHIFTTLGSKCNFILKDYTIQRQLTSERYTYNAMWVALTNISDSQYGRDKLSVKDLKTVIPKEALSRGVVTTYTDLNNAFNAIQTENCKIYFLERVHNQIERLFFSYLLMKDGSNIIPTNTITAVVTRGIFDDTNKHSFILKPGSTFYIDPDTKEITGIASPSATTIETYDKRSFLYMNPFLTVINKSPFYVSYYMTIMDYYRTLYFEYVNEDSLLQFITLSFKFQREYYTDPDTFKMYIDAAQNIDTDFQMVTYSAGGGISKCNFDMYAVFYTVDIDGEEIPVRYCKGELFNFDSSTFTYTFEFKFTTNDQISALGTYMTITSGLYSIKEGVETSYAIAPNMRMKVFYLCKFDKPSAKGRVYGENEQLSVDDLIPGLSAYTLTNVYKTNEEGIDIFYDYSDIQTSYIELATNSIGSMEYTIHKIPVVRYTYLNSEERIKNLFRMIDKKRRYIQKLIILLENSFGIDYKFFNTYGPSKLYNIDNEFNIDRINLSLVFEIKFQITSERTYLPMIQNSIKEYIEDMNYISDLHMPNLITYITNIYRDQLVYIKFIKLNDYGSLHQSIYKNPILDANYFMETQTVPEFINVNTLNNNFPDIQFKIIE